MTATNKTPNNTPMTAPITPSPVWELSFVSSAMFSYVTDSEVGEECESVVVTDSVFGGGRKTRS